MARWNAPEERGLMRVGELAEATGVSVQTIHYYIRDGLLPPPIKTAPNMAYYGAQYVEEIRFIKELQQKRYLPLAMIKLVLKAKRDGQDVSHLDEMRVTIEELFRPTGLEEDLAPMTAIQLVVMTGMSVPMVEELERIGLLMPVMTPDGKRYDGIDARIAGAARKLMDLGLEPSDLRCYGRYAEALRTEAAVMHEKLHQLHSAGRMTASLQEVKAAMDTIKSSLAARVYRQEALSHDSGDDAQ
ncbi:MAG: MerR family transcriptional regulator [Chloroflexi bacterium]|nr:MerR family transcriptional regulator [Chloroflexota bacterium]